MPQYVDRWWTSPDGVALHARDYAGAAGPAAAPVFCLHGLTRNARDFEDLAPAIAASGRRVLAFDVRGRGGSGYAEQPEDYAIPVYVADVIRWAEALGVGRADFIGTSMGGLILMGLAAQAPALIGDAVLNDIGPEVAPEGLARILSYAGAAPAWSSRSQAVAYVATQNGGAFPDYGPQDWETFAARLLRDEAGHPVLDYDPRIALPMRAAAGQPAPDLWPLFDRLAEGRRLLLVRGERSDVLDVQTADQMAARAALLTRVDVPNVGHAPTLNEPAALAAILDFLKAGS